MKRRTWSLLGTVCGSILLSELSAQQLVQLRRVGLAGGRLHDLTYEESEQLVLARAVLGELSGIAGHHLIDHALDSGGIGDLPQTLRVDHRIRARAFPPHWLEHPPGDLSRKWLGADAPPQPPRSEKGPVGEEGRTP